MALKRFKNNQIKTKKAIDKQSALCDIPIIETERTQMTDFLDMVASLETDLRATSNKPLPEGTMKAEVVARGNIGYWEPCPKCSGTGLWRGIKTCFTCKGNKGKSFATSPETRKANAAKRSENKLAKVEQFKQDKPEVFAWLTTNAGPHSSNGFAVSLMTSLATYGSLTDNQVAAVERSIEKHKANKAALEARKANAPVIDASKITHAFDTALAKANRPGAKGIWLKPLNLQYGFVNKENKGKTYTFEHGGTGKWSGFVFVKENGVNLGYIKENKFVRKAYCSEVTESEVLSVANDPMTAAIAYGKAWSRCACCGRTLTNDNSIEEGIGPICASRLMGG